MNYANIYNQLIQSAQDRQTLDGYKEKHHIIPRCVQGTNDKSNLVYLTAREHLIAHRLLDKIYPDNYKIFFALWSMLTMKTNNMQRISNSREYEKAKIRLRSVMSLIQTGSKRPPRTPEHTAKIVAAQKGRVVSEETRSKIREARKSQTWSDEQRLAQSIRLSGSGNHFFGKTHSDQTKSKISANNAASKKVSCDGVIYESMVEAAAGCGFKHYETIKKRCRSDKYPNWFFI
jgi:hypothetical protein